MFHKIKKYGWRKDQPDLRDRLYLTAMTKIPTSIDLRSQCSPIYDQGELGSCTANAIAAAIEFDRLKQKLLDFVPSRLFIYYNERAIEGTIESDAGASIRDGIKSVNNLGACSESEWPYDITQFAVSPVQQCYSDAKLDKVMSYQSIKQDLYQMKGCLASGYPFVYGFTVYESFESQAVADTGIVPMPHFMERVLGGHAVMAVGYDDAKAMFIVRNSWGDSWGDKGYFYMPYAYLTHARLASDFWLIRIVGS